jgi:DNA-binding CsgD family transcriptional regulator
MAWALVSTLSRTRRPAEALAVADQALAEADVPAVWRARLRSMRAMALEDDERSGEADSVAADTLAEAERIGDRFAAGFCLHVRSVVCLNAGDLARGLEFIERALAVIGDDQETADLRLVLSLNQLAALTNLDRVSGAELDQVLTLAERNGTARATTARLMVAEVLFELGRWDDALTETEALLQPGGNVERPIEVSLRGLAALIAAHRDDRASVTAHLRVADHLPDHSGLWRLIGIHGLRAKAMAAERDGRPGEAAALLEPPLSLDFFADPEKLDGLADLVRCALAVGDLPTAEAAAARCERQAAQYSGGVAAAAAKRCRGLVDGDPGPLGEAVAYYRSVTRPLGLGQALEDLAVALAASGDLGAARAALGEAAEVYAGLGAQWDVLRADARLRPLGARRRRPGSRRPQVGWAALTPTEEKVAYLVAEGLSNPEIGARLFLSRYTVQVHVSRILAKLGVRSRVEVARQVAQRPEAAARSAG